MRIISGSHGGRRFTPPKKLPVRPTTDLAKESLFNILRNRFHFPDIIVIDFFAGTGGLSFEFASRGGKRITAVDKHYACVKYIQQVADEWKFPINAVKADAFSFLERFGGSADVMVADPPYDFPQIKYLAFVQLVFSSGILEEDGLLVIEHPKKTVLTDLPHFGFSRNYGGTAFSFFESPEGS